MENKEKQNPWLQIQGILKEQIDINSFETWFEPTVYIGQEDTALYIKVPNSYFKDWLSFHYTSLIQRCSQDLFGKPFNIKYIYDDSSSSFMRRTPQERKSKHGHLLNPSLNPNYTFENFVVGSCNQFCHAASVAIAKTPAKAYNPLYLYGGAGLGKTHLMNAVGHQLLNVNRHRVERLMAREGA